MCDSAKASSRPRLCGFPRSAPAFSTRRSHVGSCRTRWRIVAPESLRKLMPPRALPNEGLISCKRPCDNLRSIVATGRLGCGRRLASPAFVGCISGLGGCRRQERLDALPKVSQLGRGALVLVPLGCLQHRVDIRWRKPEWLLGQGKRRQGRPRWRRDEDPIVSSIHHDHGAATVEPQLGDVLGRVIRRGRVLAPSPVVNFAGDLTIVPRLPLAPARAPVKMRSAWRS